jgi:hypothetical protein
MSCTDFGRFYEAPPWRFVVTTLESETLTFLDHLATNRQIVHALGTAATCQADVPSDNPEINIPQTVGDAAGPFLDEGTRLLYAFRRECGATTWVCRFGGIIMQMEDRAGTEQPVSTLIAYDPWKYLYRRPVLADDSTLPGAAGVNYDGGNMSQIIEDQLNRTFLTYGTVHLDWGQHLEYGGVLETTDDIPLINFQRGASIGELIDILVATGTGEVVIDPVYDPLLRPGIVGELSVYARAGAPRYGSVFGWDRFPRSLTNITCVTDGTLRANMMQWYAGQGGVPVGERINTPSINRYGVYYEQNFVVDETEPAAVQPMVEKALALLRNGQTTYTLSPASERAPSPFTDYWLGDTVPVWASRNFREVIEGEMLRIESIPITIGDDHLERVDSLLVAVDNVVAPVEISGPVVISSVATANTLQPRTSRTTSVLRPPIV